MSSGSKLDLPVELWDRIASECDSSDLPQFALVSKDLKDVSQRHLFRHLFFRAMDDADGDLDIEDTEAMKDYYQQKSERSRIRFEGLASLPHIMGKVRSWCFTGSMTLSDDIPDDFANYEVYLAIAAHSSFTWARLLPILPQFPNLTSLHLSYVEIGHNAQAALATFQHLRVLELDRIKLTDHFALPNRLRLTNFTLITIEDPDYVQEGTLLEALFDANSLEWMCLNSPILRGLRWTLDQEGHCNNLRSLEITVPLALLDSFYGFLVDCDALTFIKVHRAWEDLIAAPSDQQLRIVDVPIRACRNLRSFSGPVCFALSLVPGRPVDRIDINERGKSGRALSTQDLMRALDACSQSAAPLIKDLCMSTVYTECGRALLNALRVYTPNLRRLSLVVNDFVGNPDELEEVVSDLEEEEEDDDDESQDTASNPHARINILDQSIPPVVSSDFSDGYPRLIADICLGRILLPETLEYVKVVQSHLFKRLAFNQYHERGAMAAFKGLASREYPNLCHLSMGTNLYFDLWEKNYDTGNWEGPDEVVI